MARKKARASSKRTRGRRSGAAARRGRAASATVRRSRKTRRKAGGAKTLITLSEIGRRTGISYPTLLRYVRLHLDKIPHEGEGRTRRYYTTAVPVFQQLRAGSTRGRRSARMLAAQGAAEIKALERRLAAVERAQQRIENRLKELSKELRRPLKLTLRR